MSRATTKTEALAWIRENHPKYKLLTWGGSSSKSTFLDTERGVQFEAKYNNFKSGLVSCPDKIFAPTKEERVQKTKETNLKRYGAPSPSQNKEVKEKIKKTNLERYGAPCSLQNKEVNQKRINTFRQKYGVDMPFQSKEIQKKANDSLYKNHGVRNPSLSKEIVQKRKETNLERWGVSAPAKNKAVYQKMKKTTMDRWGVENPFDSPKFQEKSIQTRLQRGSIKLWNGKFIGEWAQDPNLASITTIRRATKMEIDPDEVKNGTSRLEIKVKQTLLGLGCKERGSDIADINFLYDFRHNKRLPEHIGKPQKGSIYPDFCFPKLHLIIEVDGEHWHVRTPEQIEKTEYRNRIYSDFDYNVLVFDGATIKADFSFVKFNICQNLAYSLIV